MAWRAPTPTAAAHGRCAQHAQVVQRVAADADANTSSAEGQLAACPTFDIKAGSTWKH
jgi:hypothetical protein